MDCSTCNGCRGWEAARSIAWQRYAQGEYVGRARTAHVPEYRLRVDDVIDLVYRLTREESPTPYQLNVGDEIRVESFTDEALNRDLLIQPDGTVTLRLLGQVHATGRTVDQDLFSRLDLSLVSKTQQGGDSSRGYGRCFLERHAGWLQSKIVFGDAPVLGETAGVA